MAVDKRIVIAALVVAFLSLCSSSLSSFQAASGNFDLNTVPVGSRARHCWPGDSYDGAGSCGGVNSCKSPDGKCNGGRVITWDGKQWQACKYLSGANFNCKSLTPAVVAIPGFDAGKIWRA